MNSYTYGFILKTMNSLSRLLVWIHTYQLVPRFQMSPIRPGAARHSGQWQTLFATWISLRLGIFTVTDSDGQSDSEVHHNLNDHDLITTRMIRHWLGLNSGSGLRPCPTWNQTWLGTSLSWTWLDRASDSNLNLWLENLNVAAVQNSSEPCLLSSVPVVANGHTGIFPY